MSLAADGGRVDLIMSMSADYIVCIVQAAQRDMLSVSVCFQSLCSSVCVHRTETHRVSLQNVTYKSLLSSVLSVTR